MTRPSHRSDPEALGWIKLHRSILRHRLWDLPASHVIVGLTALLTVGRKPSRVWNGRDEIALAAGETLTSQSDLARAAGGEITRRVVQSALKNLSAIGFLKVRRSTFAKPESARGNGAGWCGRGIILSISNWERYQGDGGNGGAISGHSRGVRRAFSGHKQEVEKVRRREVEESGSVGAPAVEVPTDVLALFVSTFDRRPTEAETGILASLSSKPLEALAAAFHETRERGLDLSYAQAVLRFSGAPNGDYQAGRLGTGGRA